MHLGFRRMGNRVTTKVNLRTILLLATKKGLPTSHIHPYILFVDHMSKRVAKRVIFFLEAKGHCGLVPRCTGDLWKKLMSAIAHSRSPRLNDQLTISILSALTITSSSAFSDWLSVCSSSDWASSMTTSSSVRLSSSIFAGRVER